MLIFVSDNIVKYFWCSMTQYITTSYRLLQWQLRDIWRWGIEVVVHNPSLALLEDTCMKYRVSIMSDSVMKWHIATKLHWININSKVTLAYSC